MNIMMTKFIPFTFKTDKRLFLTVSDMGVFPSQGLFCAIGNPQKVEFYENAEDRQVLIVAKKDGRYNAVTKNGNRVTVWGRQDLIDKMTQLANLKPRFRVYGVKVEGMEAVLFDMEKAEER